MNDDGSAFDLRNVPLVALCVEVARRAIRGHRVPLELFRLLMGWFVNETNEALILRSTPSGDVEIYLVDRKPADEGYAGLCSMPGQIAVAGQDPREAILEVLNAEVGLGPADTGVLRELGYLFDRFEERGTFRHFVWLVTLAPGSEPTGGRWYSLMGLPENLPEQQFVMIAHGADAIRHDPRYRFASTFRPSGRTAGALVREVAAAAANLKMNLSGGRQQL